MMFKASRDDSWETGWKWAACHQEGKAAVQNCITLFCAAVSPLYQVVRMCSRMSRMFLSKQSIAFN